MTRINRILIVAMTASLLLLSSCATLQQLDTGGAQPAAPAADLVSGTFTAYEVSIAAELGGSVKSVNADQGDPVQSGESLITLDTSVIEAQIRQSETAVSAAEKNMESAQIAHQAALLQQQLLARSLRMSENQNPVVTWSGDILKDFDLPNWYFNQSDILQAARSELMAAQKNLDVEKANLTRELAKASNADVLAAEQRLAQARESYKIADQTLTAAKDAKDNKVLLDAAQSFFDAAKADLESAQLSYDQMLTTTSADAVNEARARLAVAQKRFDLVQERVDLLQSGSESPELQSSDLQVQQAEIGIEQAQVALDQANAALSVLQTQLEKYTLICPVNGIVLTRMVEPGEVLAPGSDAMVIGKLDTLTLKIYLPEEMYGQVKLGKQAEIHVDSYPGEKFYGEVVYIADQAEYTPRNVQTIEGRQNTVYGVEIRVANPDLKLKPGMPADVLVSSLK